MNLGIIGTAFVRDLLDAIEARMADAARDLGTVTALPFGMPDRLDAGNLWDLAEAVDQATRLEPSSSSHRNPRGRRLRSGSRASRDRRPILEHVTS